MEKKKHLKNTKVSNNEDLRKKNVLKNYVARIF